MTQNWRGMVGWICYKIGRNSIWHSNNILWNYISCHVSVVNHDPFLLSYKHALYNTNSKTAIYCCTFSNFMITFHHKIPVSSFFYYFAVIRQIWPLSFCLFTSYERLQQNFIYVTHSFTCLNLGHIIWNDAENERWWSDCCKKWDTLWKWISYRFSFHYLLNMRTSMWYILYIRF